MTRKKNGENVGPGLAATEPVLRVSEHRLKPVPPKELETADEEFALVDHFLGEMVVELDEELFVVDDFVAPGFVVKMLQRVEFFFGKIEAVPLHVFVIGHPADGGFAALGTNTGAIH